LNVKTAVSLLKKVGFNFESNPEFVVIDKVDDNIVLAGIDSLNAHIMSLGGNVQQNPAFDPY
jgi:hypothetical protein